MFSICHQLPQRSFLWLWDPPLLCARCTGFYLAILAALTLSALARVRLHAWSSSVIGAGCIAFLAMAAEKALDLEFGNWGRFSAALPFGFAIGVGLAMPLLSRRSQEEMK